LGKISRSGRNGHRGDIAIRTLDGFMLIIHRIGMFGLWKSSVREKKTRLRSVTVRRSERLRAP
jgi:hypothetical protein